jgi:hypothetical protein
MGTYCMTLCYIYILLLSVCLMADHIFYGLLFWSETHTNRQATRYGWLPSSLLGTGDTRINSVRWGQTFYSELTRAVEAELKSLVPARQAQRTNQRRIPFICTLWVPIHLSFNSQQGPPFSILFGYDFFLLISIMIILFKNPNHNSLFCRCCIYM